ncbi:MAG: hypothetical protein IJW29_04100 [Clostridia bacterium]|nr:hypothetical protein [Clostridia bacterium]
MSEKEPNIRHEKREAGEIVIQNRFVKWLDNFWYHHKWAIIICAIFLFAFIVCIAQCASREVSDSYVTLAGGFEVKEKDKAALEEILNDLSGDLDKKESMSVGVLSYTYYSEDELRALFTDEENGFDNEGYNRAKVSNTDRFSNLSDYVMTGECSIWFVSEAVYTQLKMADRLAVPLKTTFGNLPAGAFDACAIRLGDTAFYQYYREKLSFLPEDTLIVLTNPNAVWGASANEEQYARVKKLYRAIIEFTPPA